MDNDSPAAPAADNAPAPQRIPIVTALYSEVKWLLPAEVEAELKAGGRHATPHDLAIGG